MKIPNANNGNKVLFIFLDALFLLMIIITPLETQHILFMWVTIICSFLLFAVSLCVTFLAFGTYEINKEGISFKSFIYKKSCKWSDFKFIVKYNVHMRYVPKIGFICSHKLPKEKFKRIHTTKGFSIKFFNLPYSKKIEDLILTYGINSYSGIFTDDAKNE